jgi:hypothetical protein
MAPKIHRHVQRSVAYLTRLLSVKCMGEYNLQIQIWESLCMVLTQTAIPQKNPFCKLIIYIYIYLYLYLYASPLIIYFLAIDFIMKDMPAVHSFKSFESFLIIFCYLCLCLKRLLSSSFATVIS